MSSKIEGDIWFTGEGEQTLALEQVKLLQAIDETGSISAAAKLLNVSYKTAWERLDRLNNLSAEPLVSRTAGGSHGGGSQLTPYGQQILEGFSQVKQEHREFIEKLGENLGAIDDLAHFVKSSQLISSARNQFLGTVTAVEPGAVNAEVTLKINEQVSLVAIITEQSRLDLKVEVGTPLIALIKASSVTLTTNPEISISARNKLIGSIQRLMKGAVNTDVTLNLGDGKTLTSVVTNYSVDQLGLKESDTVCAFFKASSVILMAV